MSRILIVDDDPDLLEILSYLLTSSGYEVQTLSKGDAIFEHIAAFQPDLILMDVMLAGMDGREICKGIKANPQTLMPVILISGTHDLSLTLTQTGAPDDFLAKPFDLDELLKKVAFQLAA
ncbi:response regulator transcription factor [Mucilaginibacter aquaedulcis]|uniref:response regulator transcription factor n=1 Tax=Mucilaginibacter aquaedulcis TaxID=1187081 RepID=UPI0025B2D8B4|nr:response regulator transcription factor [Mucilaginibacter aquaedulcis]MDN3547838.1 response regulator transcription factor [Mucilaginibacter aquaedulcis]